MPPLIYEDFSRHTPAKPLQAGPVSDQEDRLAAYEEGYRAGWDDAAAAEAKIQTRIDADFAQTLQELSFTYHEARSHILNGLAPILTLMVEKVLPNLAGHGFAATIADIVHKAAGMAADQPVELVISPSNRAALDKLLHNKAAPPIKIVEEVTLGPGQVYLRQGAQEQIVDFDALVAGIQNVVDDFLNTDTSNERAFRHG